MGVSLDGKTPRNPYRSTSIFDQILDAAGSLGSGLASGFQGLLNGIGNVLSDAGQFVGDVFHGVVQGVTDFIGWVGSAIGNIFGGGGQADPPEPPPPIYNPIKTNLEAVLQPKFEEVDRLRSKSETIGGQIEGIQEEYRQKLGEQGTITKSLESLSGDLAKKVNSETFTEYEEGMEEQLWGENGELWRLNSVMWDENTGWQATQEVINDQQDEINILNNERNDLQDQVSLLNTQMLESVQEYVSRTMYVPGFQGAYDEHFSVTPSGSRWRVEALGDWTGEYILQSAYFHSGRNAWEPVLDFENIPRDDASSPRVRFHDGSEYSTILQYWVRQAVHRSDNESTGRYRTDQWTTRNDLSFTAPIDAEYSIWYRVIWEAATYSDSYAFRVVKNGQEIMKWGPMTHVGPPFPGPSGSGRRVRTLNELNVSLKADDVLTFQTYSNASQASQRMIESSERRISWLMPFGSTWVLESNGSGGWVTDPDLEGTVDFVHWQDSARFLISDVVAGTAVGVWDGYNYVTTPAGTVIPRNAWIRTIAPHPSSVTFRKRN